MRKKARSRRRAFLDIPLLDRKEYIEDLSEKRRISINRGAAEKKQVWEDVHKRYGTQKKKSVKFE